ETLAKNVKETSEALRALDSADAEKMAKKLSEGMKSAGGAAAAIAEDFTSGVTPGADLAAGQERMLEKIASRASQSIEARRGSLIENVTQKLGKGAFGKQTMVAEDQSTIKGASQEIDSAPK